MRWSLLALLCGCYQPSPLSCEVRCTDSACPPGLACAGPNQLCIAPGESCPADDAPVPVDCAPGTIRVGTGRGLVQLCLPSVGDGTATIAGKAIDTDNPADDCQLLNVDGDDVCVLASENVDIVGKLSAHGSRRFVVAATGTITIMAGIVVSVASTTMPDVDGAGAGAAIANAPTCGTPSGTTVATTGDGAGGAPGGRFANQLPGAGGPSTQATSRSIAPLDIEPPRFRAGCQGGSGGDSGVTSAGRGGKPGGAIYFLADTIIVNGIINASGAGGGASPANTGGNGGGSGGFIGFDAVSQITIDTTANVFALGGAGGGGGRAAMPGVVGKSAVSATTPAPTTTVLCDSTNGELAGGGGAGSSGVADANPGTAPSLPSLTTCGGGGGGGGSGRIMAFGPTLTNLAGGSVAPALEHVLP